MSGSDESLTHLGIISEDDILSTRLSNDDKLLALQHVLRLKNTIDDKDVATNTDHTHKRAAREGLARMTIVLEDYKIRYERGEIDEMCESMIADLVEAAVSVGGARCSHYQSAFPNLMLIGREQEIMALVQKMENEEVEKASTAWRTWTPNDNIVPDHQHFHDADAEVDWKPILFRSKSYDNLLHHQQRHIVVKKKVKDRPRFKRELSTQDTQTLIRSWPPPAVELNEKLRVSRARAETESHWEWSPSQNCVCS